MSELSIIIVNYDGQAFLNACLQSIEEHCADIDYEIILVDNNSTDFSLESINQKYSNLKIIKNASNLGFAKANNIGASQSIGEFILLLNNDTLLLNSLKPAINLIKHYETIGAVGIKMLDEKKMYKQSAGHFPSALRLLKLKSLFMQKQGFSDGNFEKNNNYFTVDWIEASFLLTSKNTWNELKGMDDTFYLYAEDIDFCKRISLLEKKTVYLPELSYIHFGGFNTKRNKLLKKGLIHYVDIHFTGLKKWLSRINIEINFFVKEYVKKSV